MKVGFFERWFIWFWYSDMFRVLCIVFPAHLILTVPFMIYFDFNKDFVGFLCWMQYFIMILLAIASNDYSELRKIGMDEYRNKIKIKQDQ
jgi:hypothetical protein